LHLRYEGNLFNLFTPMVHVSKTESNLNSFPTMTSTYRELQAAAKEAGIAANQSKAVLEELLASPTLKNTQQNSQTPTRRSDAARIELITPTNVRHNAVGFASPLSPEMIDKSLPPATPVTRGRQPKPSPGRSSKQRGGASCESPLSDGGDGDKGTVVDGAPPPQSLATDPPVAMAYGVCAAFFAMLAAAWWAARQDRDGEGGAEAPHVTFMGAIIHSATDEWQFTLGVGVASLACTSLLFHFLLR
jgi:hypothetical protein